jgi:hypothetical protein
MFLESADSMAWSFTARRENIRLPGCNHKNCFKCHTYAMQWYRKQKDKADRGYPSYYDLPDLKIPSPSGRGVGPGWPN